LIAVFDILIFDMLNLIALILNHDFLQAIFWD